MLFLSQNGFYSEANLDRLEELQMTYIIPLRRDNKAIDYGLPGGIESKQSYFSFRDWYVFYANQQHGDMQIYLFVDGRLKEEKK